MRPDEVTSPRTRLRDLEIVYDAGAWSIARMQWQDREGRWDRRIGMRWNGADDELGNPVSSAQPTWFLLPVGLIADVAEMYGRAQATLKK